MSVSESLLFDRLPPNNARAESAALACALASHKAALRVLEDLRRGDFYHGKHQHLYDAIEATIYGSDGQANYQTVYHWLEKEGKLDRIGGIEGLTSAADGEWWNASEVQYYTRIVRECAERREGIRLAGEWMSRCYEGSELPETTREWLVRELLSRGSDGDHEPMTLREALRREALRVERQQVVPVMFTGVSALDAMTGGLQDGDLSIICGRPGGGKSCLLLQWAQHAAQHWGPGAYLTLEMDEDSLARRLISSVTGFSFRSLRDLRHSTGDPFQEEDAAAVRHWVQALSDTEHDIYLDRRTHQLRSLIARAHRWKLQYQIRSLFVDYAQLLKDDEADGRVDEVGRVARGLKNLAQELGIPVVLAAQAGRDVEKRGTKDRPALLKLHDLAWASELEAAANQIILLNRDPDAGAPPTDGRREAKVLALAEVAKSRNDGQGFVPLIFDKPGFRFLSRDTRHEGEEPPAEYRGRESHGRDYHR